MYNIRKAKAQVVQCAGVALSAWAGEPVKAAADGRITYSACNAERWGYTVEIQHRSGYRTIYAHNSRNLCVVGQQVRQGDVIAQVGSGSGR